MSHLTLNEFLFHSAAEGVLIADPEMILIRMNPAAAVMLGISPAESLGRSVGEVFAGQRQLIQLFLPGGSSQARIRLERGRLAQAVAGEIDEGRVVLLNDVTERYELESRREALIQSIAHDLRNPINALAGYADLIAKFGDLNAQQEKFLSRIRQTTGKLYEMTAKLVDLAWIEAGMPMEHLPVELAGLTRDVIHALSYEAGKAGLSIVNSIPDELPPVMGDPKRLRQVIYNLLDNAIRYSSSGGNVVIHAWHQNEAVYCTVADQGIGIAEHEQAMIWDRLWRSQDEAIRDIPGAGIGLTYVRAILKRYGSTITLESRPGYGSTFTFMLPLSLEK